jgi:hypothetical protein
MMKSVDDSSFYTNTSLRRTARNRLIGAGVPAEIVSKKLEELVKLLTA